MDVRVVIVRSDDELRRVLKSIQMDMCLRHNTSNSYLEIVGRKEEKEREREREEEIRVTRMSFFHRVSSSRPEQSREKK